MTDYNSDSDDSYDFDDSDNDGGAESSSSPALRSNDAPGPSTLVPQDANGRAIGIVSSDSLVREFVSMGFPKEMVLKASKHLKVIDGDELLSVLLAYQYVGDGAPLGNCSTSRCAPQSVGEEGDGASDVGYWDDGSGAADRREPKSGSSDYEGFLQGISQNDDKIKLLVNMGFTKDEADLAISRCGLHSDVDVLVDSITSSQIAEDVNSRDHEFPGMVECKKKRKWCERGGAQGSWDDSHADPMSPPHHMVGLSLPNGRIRSINRRLPEEAIGPPYFYHEDIALAPRDVWARISRLLYNIPPEFMDSKYMCAAARERGYTHNLPIDNRSLLRPIPQKTIFRVFPHSERWWPSWDTRTQLDCLQTCKASPKLLNHIYNVLASFDDIPPPQVQDYVREMCKKWNLIWIGKHRVASLDPQDIEYLLGFPKDYTRGVTTTDRYKCLENAFQIDTVAYHLSVLKDRFPNGINVLSLFSGIGGAEVALHKLGIHMTVVSVEISKVSRKIFRSWWVETQSGTLNDEINDVRSLTGDTIRALIRKYGGFDLIIGGTACNITGRNRHHNHGGLDGEQFSLLHEYVRILNTVRSAMGRM